MFHSLRALHAASNVEVYAKFITLLPVVSCPYVLRQLDPKSWLGVQIGVLVPRDSDPNSGLPGFGVWIGVARNEHSEPNTQSGVESPPTE